MWDEANREASPLPPPDAPRVGYLDILRLRDIRVVVFGTFVIMLGYGILSPILPLYARSFHVGYDAVGLLVSAFAFTRLLTDLGCGALVNRFGERAMVAAGAIVVGVSSGLAAVAPTFALLVLFRAAGGAGSAVFFAAMMSYLFKSAPRALLGRVMGVFFGAFNLGIILGNPLGGVVAHFFGLSSPLWFYAGACFVAAGVYLRSVRDPKRSPADAAAGPGGLRTLRWNRAFLSVLASNLAYFWMVAATFSTLVSLFGKDRIGLSPLGVGVGLAIASAAEFAVLFPAGSATDRRGGRPAGRCFRLRRRAHPRDAESRGSRGTARHRHRRVPVRGRPGVRVRAARGGGNGLGVRLHRRVRGQRDSPGRRGGDRAHRAADVVPGGTGGRGLGLGTEVVAMDVMETIAQAKDALTVRRVFGEPYERDGVTVIPAARLQGGGGGGGSEGGPELGKGAGSGFGLMARPVGAFVIREGRVSWQPAVDVTRIVLGGQVVAVVALLTIRTIVRARVRSKRVDLRAAKR